MLHVGLCRQNADATLSVLQETLRFHFHIILCSSRHESSGSHCSHLAESLKSLQPPNNMRMQKLLKQSSQTACCCRYCPSAMRTTPTFTERTQDWHAGQRNTNTQERHTNQRNTTHKTGTTARGAQTHKRGTPTRETQHTRQARRPEEHKHTREAHQPEEHNTHDRHDGQRSTGTSIQRNRCKRHHTRLDVQMPTQEGATTAIDTAHHDVQNPQQPKESPSIQRQLITKYRIPTSRRGQLPILTFWHDLPRNAKFPRHTVATASGLQSAQTTQHRRDQSQVQKPMPRNRHDANCPTTTNTRHTKGTQPGGDNRERTNREHAHKSLQGQPSQTWKSPRQPRSPPSARTVKKKAKHLKSHVAMPASSRA